MSRVISGQNQFWESVRSISELTDPTGQTGQSGYLNLLAPARFSIYIFSLQYQYKIGCFVVRILEMITNFKLSIMNKECMDTI